MIGSISNLYFHTKCRSIRNFQEIKFDNFEQEIALPETLSGCILSGYFFASLHHNFSGMESKTKAWLALIFICIAWGTTYLGIKICVEAFPSFLMAGVRQFTAGILIFFIALSNRSKPDLSRRNILRHVLIGFLMITMGNGLVSWGEQYIPSGVAALICAVMPVFAVLINVFVNKAEKINLLIGLGMITGFLGIALNFRNSIADLANSKYIIGILVTLVATFAWGLGSVVSRKHYSNSNPVFNSAIQVASGGFFLLLFSPAVDDYSTIQWHNTEAFISLLYLIIIGSVAAYTAYMYALKNLPVGIVMVYAYVNPLVAVLLGWWWKDEPLTIYTMLSFVAIMLGVYLVNKGYRKARLKAG